MAFSNIIPVMTSNTAPSGTVSAGSTEGGGYYMPWNAFDGNVYTFWSSLGGDVPNWLGYEFPAAKLISAYAIADRADANVGRFPTAWRLEGWSGSEWVILDARSNETFYYGQRREFTVTSPIPCKSYRLYVLSVNSGSWVQIPLLELSGVDASPPVLRRIRRSVVSCLGGIVRR